MCCLNMWKFNYNVLCTILRLVLIVPCYCGCYDDRRVINGGVSESCNELVSYEDVLKEWWGFMCPWAHVFDGVTHGMMCGEQDEY